MTDMFDKFMEYSHLDETGHRRMNDDAPEKLKEEAKKADALFYERTGRHMFHFDEE